MVCMFGCGVVVEVVLCDCWEMIYKGLGFFDEVVCVYVWMIVVILDEGFDMLSDVVCGYVLLVDFIVVVVVQVVFV